MNEVAPIFVGLPQTPEGRHGLTLLQSDTAANLASKTMTAEERAALIWTARAVCGSLTPAKPEEIALEIEALALHYPAFNRTAQESRVANAHWLDDLADWPADLVREACRRWRNSSERYFPTPGQLKAMAASELAGRRIYEDRARDYLRLVEQAA